MSDLPTGVVVSLVFAAAGAAVMAVTVVRSRRLAPDVGEFLDDIELADAGDYRRRVAEPFRQRVLAGIMRSVSQRLEKLLPSQYLETVERQLAQAGLTGRRRASHHVAVQLGLTVACGVLAVPAWSAVSSPGQRLGLLLLPGIGFMLPSVRLKRAIRERSDAIFKDLPDIIDMLAIAMEAGSGFESAVSLVCRHFDSPMARELEISLQEMSLGTPRRQALQNLKQRTDLDVVRTFVLALVQADELGIPLGRVLKTQAIEIRNRRRAWAREKAAKLPVKILFPLVLFIFPPILAIVLGPAGLTFSTMR